MSEANLDLIALLTFAAVCKAASRRGQEKLLVLDDVLQSVDATVRLEFVDLLATEFADWQLVFTVHDRLWYMQLRDLFRRHGKQPVSIQIGNWSFGDGPAILNMSLDLPSRLRRAIRDNDSQIICACCGLLLEAMCNELSWRLGTSVVRRKEDKYVLGDLWPGLLKALRKTNLREAILEVDKWMHLRNLVGAHHNEWALSLSVSESVRFADAVMSMYHRVMCGKCFRWIEKVGRVELSCRCGELRVAVV